MKGKLFSVDWITVFVVIIVLGLIATSTQKAAVKSRVDKYLDSHSEISEIHKEAMQKGIILRGMTKEQVEAMKGKGSLTQLQGIPAYCYKKQVFSYHEDWYVVYDKYDIVAWTDVLKYDTSRQKQQEVTVKKDMLQEMMLIELRKQR